MGTKRETRFSPPMTRHEATTLGTARAAAFSVAVFVLTLSLTSGGSGGGGLAAANPTPSGRIMSLPGLSGNGPLTAQYSGYIAVNTSASSGGGNGGDGEVVNAAMFYWFVESAAPDNGDLPIVIWLQGGPGGSSLYGLFVENGPYHITPHLELTENPYSWHNAVHMLYIDNPVGTGFSFTDYYQTSQAAIAENMLTFLTGFFEQYAQYEGRPLFLFGESYAGKYIP